MTQKCGCRGIRFCAECKDSDRVTKMRSNENLEEFFKDYESYVFNPDDGQCYSSPDISVISTMDDIKSRTTYLMNLAENERSNLEFFKIEGLLLLDGFLSEEEESKLVDDMEKTPWVQSQSGRRKQDYGPRVNFKGKKIKCDRFVGVPEYADYLLQRMSERSKGILGDYQPFELCNLEYHPERLSSIELHKDDIWIWGNRLISLNLLNDGIMTYENQDKKKIVFLYMDRRSLLSMYDDARYIWRHGIFSHHIPGRRIALTMREPATAFKPGGELYEEYGKELIERGTVRIKIS